LAAGLAARQQVRRSDLHQPEEDRGPEGSAAVYPHQDGQEPSVGTVHPQRQSARRHLLRLKQPPKLHPQHVLCPHPARRTPKDKLTGPTPAHDSLWHHQLRPLSQHGEALQPAARIDLPVLDQRLSRLRRTNLPSPASGRPLPQRQRLSSLRYGFLNVAQLESKISVGVNSGTGTNDGVYRVRFDDEMEVCFITPGGEVSGLAHGERKFNFVGKCK
jgi:hypothetical protein